MIRLTSIFFLINVCYSQYPDSLFWFDMNTVREPLPEFPLILNKVLDSKQLKLLDSLRRGSKLSEDGFRIQVFETVSSADAYDKVSQLQELLGDTIYLDFEAPLYKLRFGNFPTRKAAAKHQKIIIKRGITEAWIVRARIDIDALLDANEGL